VIVLDYSQVAISTLMTELKGATSVDINIPLMRHMIINAVRSHKMKFGSEFGPLVIACDSRNYWRKREFPYYKASRKKSREDSGIDWAALFEALNLVKQELSEYFPYPVIEVNGAEADDIIGTLALWSQTNDRSEGVGLFEDESSKPFLVLSGDHDFQQLQRFDNVKQFNPIMGKWITVEGTPAEVLMEHIIQGDRGDGVPNFLSPDNSFVDKIRQKSIMKKNLEQWKKMKPEDFITNPEHMKNFRRNELLIDLSKIPQDVQDEIVSNYTTQIGLRDKTKILNYLIANKMNLLIDHLTDF
jgi:hypothetical protein